MAKSHTTKKSLKRKERSPPVEQIKEELEEIQEESPETTEQDQINQEVQDYESTPESVVHKSLPKYFSKLNIMVIAGSIDSTLCGWKFNQKNLESFFAVKCHSGIVSSVSSKNSLLYTGGYDENINTYDLINKSQMGIVEVGQGTIEVVVPFSTTHLFVGTSNGSFLSYETNEFFSCVLNVAEAHKGKLISIAIHPSGKAALTVGDDRRLKLWNLVTGACDFSTRMRTVCEQVAWSPSGETFAYLKGNDVMVYSQKLELVAKLAHSVQINCFSYLNEFHIVTGGENKALCVYDIASEELLYKIEDVHSARIKSIATLIISKSDEFLMSAVDTSGGVSLWTITPESVTLLDYLECGARLTSVTIAVPHLARIISRTK